MTFAPFTATRERPAARRAGPDLRVVANIHEKLASECAEVLEKLLELARAGRITGLNWEALTNEREIIVGRTGVLKRNNALALLTSSRKSISIIDGM